MTVPIPMRMLHLPRDARGYPVPAGVLIDRDGIPQFTVNDEAARHRHIAEDRCSICGGTLVDTRWFVGGPRAAFHDAGAYMDPPSHEECAHYALQVCPFLAAPKYARRIDDKKMSAAAAADMAVLADMTQIPERPQVFVAVLARRTVRSGLYIKPSRPYLAVEYWQHGERLGAEEGQAIARRVMTAPLPELQAPRVVRVGRSVQRYLDQLK